MSITSDRHLVILFSGVVLLLIMSTLAGRILSSKAVTESARATVDNLNALINSWWWMCLAFGFALLSGPVGTVVLFGLVSFLALREFITLTPTRRADHRTLFWCFFVITPLQYVLVGIGWYGLFSILIPVYAFLFIPARSSLAGDTERFLERTAKIHWV